MDIHGVVIKKVVWTAPHDPEKDDPKATVTLELPGDHITQVKALLDFAGKGPCTWTIETLKRELAAALT